VFVQVFDGMGKAFGVVVSVLVLSLPWMPMTKFRLAMSMPA
jgi:hypothetical protein